LTSAGSGSLHLQEIRVSLLSRTPGLSIRRPGALRGVIPSWNTPECLDFGGRTRSGTYEEGGRRDPDDGDCAPLKRRSASTRLHDAISQKAVCHLPVDQNVVGNWRLQAVFRAKQCVCSIQHRGIFSRVFLPPAVENVFAFSVSRSTHFTLI
jgi:hypothetical protein